MINIHVVKQATVTVEEKLFTLIFPYLKLMNSLKVMLNSCKFQIVFKNKIRLGKDFHFKEGFP